MSIHHHRRKDSLRTVSYEFLKTLLSTPGPSGGEGAAANIWREEAKKFAEVRGDKQGRYWMARAVAFSEQGNDVTISACHESPELAYERLVAGMKELRVVPADWDV